MAMNDAIRSSSWRKPTGALRLVWVFAALSLLTAASDLRGQGNIALHGVVEDETGIGIAGARLTLLATTTTLTRKANANKTGQFGFDDLPAGTYVLHAEAVEFQSVDVPVSVGSSPLEPLRITLAYTDVPGFPGAIPALVNDLDLEVVAPVKARAHRLLARFRRARPAGPPAGAGLPSPGHRRHG